MLEIKNVTKVFPGVKALDDVSVTFKASEIHALIGENGAGKSTLINIICGVFQPDVGELYIDGEQVKFHYLNDAINAGLSKVNQEIRVIPNSSIGENIMMEQLHKFRNHGMIRWDIVHAEARKALDMIGLDLPTTMPIGSLSAAKKQLVQIAKAIALNSKIILLDEPTSSLTLREAEKLFKIMHSLKEQGKVIVFVSHKIEEVLSVCDKLTVLRDGRYIGTRNCNEVQKHDVVKLMIGRETNEDFLGFLNINDNEYVLEAKNICKAKQFDNISLSLKKGEILGLYGLVGSGRTELARIIVGVDKADSGKIFINGKEARISNMSDSLENYRMGYITENRKEEGLILTDTVKTNLTITIWKMIRDTFLKKINLKKEDSATNRIVNELDIRAASTSTAVMSLSGGNQQKISIGKWLNADCDILIIDEPTVGIDVGAKESIYKIIWDLAVEKGKSIILISSDMPELIKLSRRILVFREFQIVDEITGLNEKQHSYNEVSSMIGKNLTY